MTRPTAVFVEVSSPGWAFWRAALDTCVGLSIGTLYTFLGIVVVGIVGEAVSYTHLTLPTKA